MRRALSPAARTPGSQPPQGSSSRSDLTLVLAAALAATLVAASLLLLVGVRVAQVQTGYRVHDLRSELVRLKQERAALDVEKGSLLRPARLAQLARTQLDLVPVDGARALNVNDPPKPPPAKPSSTKGAPEVTR
jgi:cell division protein FtsL